MNEQQNVKTIQDMFAAFQRGDIDSIIGRLDERILWIIPGSPALKNSGTRRGEEQVRQFFSGLAETTEFTVFEPRDYIAQNNRVVSIVHYEGRDRQTGRNFSGDAAMVWTIENGKVTRFEEFTDTEALAAASAPGAAAGSR